MVRSGASKAQRSVGDEISRDNKPTSDTVEHLQRQLANAFVLYANYKHYHWQTFGPLFRDLHLLFDEFAQADATQSLHRGLHRTAGHVEPVRDACRHGDLAGQRP